MSSKIFDYEMMVKGQCNDNSFPNSKKTDATAFLQFSKNINLYVRCPRCRQYYDVTDTYSDWNEKCGRPMFSYSQDFNISIHCDNCDLILVINKLHFQKNVNRDECSRRFEDPKFQEKMKIAQKATPNNLEMDFLEIMSGYIPNLRYTGDSFVPGISKRPDFTIDGTNKYIDLFGIYWHKRLKEVEERTVYFESRGLKLLIIWEDEWKRDRQTCINNILEFTSRHGGEI